MITSRGWAAAWLVLAAGGCALAPPSRDPAPPPEDPAETQRAISALQAAEVRFEQEDYDGAAAAADSLYRSWQGIRSFGALAIRARWLEGRAQQELGELALAATAYEDVAAGEDERLRDEAVARLLEIWGEIDRGEDAIRLAFERRISLDDEARGRIRELAGGLGEGPLEDLVEDYAVDVPGAEIVHLELAQRRVSGGDTDEARRIARDVLSTNPGEPERSLANLLVDAEGDITQVTVRVGAILPLSGQFASVGQLLREGLELAEADYRTNYPNGFPLELVIVDDGSDAGRAADLVRDLERQGVVAVIGPLRSEGFAAAAEARANSRLVLISPTATEVREPAPNAYTLYERGRRERDVANDLAEWSVRELGLRRFGMLHSNAPAGQLAARSFATAIDRASASVLSTQAYDPATTTFSDQIGQIAAAQPEGVFVPGSDPQAILTLAPQLFYYGLDRSLVLGGNDWGDPSVLRRLEPFASDMRVVGVWLDRSSPGTRWEAFRNDYERTYRKALRDNVLPGLAYDAFTVIGFALNESRLPFPSAVAQYLSRSPALAGVTGRLRPDPATSTFGRVTQIRMIMDGELRPADRDLLLDWLRRARAGGP